MHNIPAKIKRARWLKKRIPPPLVLKRLGPFVRSSRRLRRRMARLRQNPAKVSRPMTDVCSAEIRTATAEEYERAVQTRRRRLPKNGRRFPRPGARRDRAAARPCPARRKGATWACWSRSKPGRSYRGGPGRSAGDDRYLRFCHRPVAPALRPDHRFRAAKPSHDGAVASAWRCRRDHGV